MNETFCLNEKFTFRSSWITAMSHIASKAVRNRLTASIIEYGLNSRHVPVGNSTADAILSMAMDQIDRESGRKTRREVYAECVRSFREQEEAMLDERLDRDNREFYNELYGESVCDESADDEPAGNADGCSDADAGSGQKAADVCPAEKMPENTSEKMPEKMSEKTSEKMSEKIPEKIPVAVGADTVVRRPGRIVKGRLHIPVKQRSKSVPKKKGNRSHRRRRR